MTYRRVTTPDGEKQTPIDQPAPMLDWVRIDRMVIDDSYQRELGRTNWTTIRKIAADFRWSRFSPVLLAPVQNGQFAIIDGQHRAHAAAICGFEAVPAMIVPIEKAEQAQAFAQINSAITRVTAHQIYKAALAAREDWAVTARATVEVAGCRLMTFKASSKAKGPREVYCIGLVTRLVKMGRARELGAALAAIVQYDTQSRVALYSDYILQPFVSALCDVPDFDRIALNEFLTQNDPFRLLNTVDKMVASGELSGAKPALYRRAFVAKLRSFTQAKAA